MAKSAEVQAEAAMTTALAMKEMAKTLEKLADAAALQAQNDARLIEVLENLIPKYNNQ